MIMQDACEAVNINTNQLWLLTVLVRGFSTLLRRVLNAAELIGLHNVKEL